MVPSKRFMRIIRKNILLFSGIVFAVSALLLLVAISQEPRFTVSPNKADVEPWLEAVEEVLKGLLAASAVAFLYDWILKLESNEQLEQIIQDKLETFKFSVLGVDSDSKLNHSVEIIFSPLTDIQLMQEDKHRFCRMSVHCRFLSKYFGDEIKVMFFISGVTSELQTTPPCIFYWLFDEPPVSNPSEKWLEVTNFQVDGNRWDVGEPRLENNVITVKCRRPRKDSSPRNHIVTYSFDIRTLDNYSPPKNFSYVIDKKMINPMFRVDARPLKAKEVRASVVSFSNPKKFSHRNYVSAPEANGTCQVNVDGILEKGQTLTFTIIGNAIP